MGAYELARLYGTAGAAPTAMFKAGGQQAASSVAAAGADRIRKLKDAVNAGTLDPKSLGPNDRSLLTQAGVAGVSNPLQGKSIDIPTGIFGKIGGGLANLGGDIKSYAYSIPGLLNPFIAAGKDEYNFLVHGDASLKNSAKIAKPIAASYADKYGHGPKHFLSETYHHPLGTILDVATLASGGAALGARAGALATTGANMGRLGSIAPAARGSTAFRTGSQLAKLTSREGRAPFVHPITGQEMAREYTSRPISKVVQIGLDKIAKTGHEENKLGHALRVAAQNKETRTRLARMMSSRFGIQQHALTGMEMFKELAKDPDQELALYLLQKGINSPGTIEAFEKMVDSTRNNSEKMLELQRVHKVDSRILDDRAQLNPRVKNLILNPTDLMKDSHEIWKQRVREQQAVVSDLTPERIEKHLQMERDILAPHIDSSERLPVSTVYMRNGDHPLGEHVTEDPAKATDQTTHPFSPSRTLDLHNPDDMDAFRAVAARHGLTTRQLTGEDAASEAGIALAREDLLSSGIDAIRIGDGEHIVIDPQAYEAGVRPVVPPHGIEHVFVPTSYASGMKLHEPSRLQTALTGNDTPRWRASRRNSSGVERGVRYDETLFSPSTGSHAFDSEGTIYSSGAFRSDARQYLEHAADRVKELQEKEFAQNELLAIAAWDPDKDAPKLFRDGPAIDAYFLRHQPGYVEGSMVGVNSDMSHAYFKAEQNTLEKTAATINAYLKDHGSDLTVDDLLKDTELQGVLDQMLAADANAFVATNWAKMRKPVIAIPREDYDHRVALANLTTAYPGKAARSLAWAMNKWRMYVLTYMPRWGVNTALGSLVMNILRGVNPYDYHLAHKLYTESKNPMAGAASQRFLPEGLSTAERPAALPSGASLGHQATQSMLEEMSPGWGKKKYETMMNDLGFHGVTHQRMTQGVQNIEDFFRRAMFVSNLRREGRLERVAQATGTAKAIPAQSEIAFGDLRDGLQHFYKETLGLSGSVTDALMNPNTVKRALDETDKMMYAYHTLTPFERRTLRQFIPFWGWYRFISMAAYRMGVEMPGRMNLLRNLNAIAQEQESQFGPLPEWLHGAIPLGVDKDGQYHYISTLGMNPFGTIANPIGKGGVNAMVSLGQFSPIIQAYMAAQGLDTLTGQPVSVSPLEGVGTSFTGQMYDKDGKPVAPNQVAGNRRLIMGVFRSIPQFRFAERYLVNPATTVHILGQNVHGFGTPSPESVPLLAPRPQGATEPITRDVIGSTFFGLGRKTYNLSSNQQFNLKQGSYAGRSNLTHQRTLLRKLLTK